MKKLILVVFFAAGIARSEPVFHLFNLWGDLSDVNKAWIYYGWTNGLIEGLAARSEAGSSGARLDESLPLFTCLENVGAKRAIAAIDELFYGSPETRKLLIGDMIMRALTRPGAPCAGKRLVP